ncbi:hypothetical protein HPT25_19645 [Bacillus sp. BRMEA1]|uniref:hypothetical protein n=1 Tax=Neobacillus endophyticus TaxID=2738405 RepID=UPI0015660FD7|nr:hypothetical protein [Neobacillus endophyticus]NRD79578.1 hypothetical protein [Neobacillus endophyticus]
MKNKTFINAFFLILLITFVAYLESPYSFINKDYAYSTEEPVLTQPVTAKPDENTPETIEKLDKTKKENGYIIETYKEYEIYRDKDGKVTKEEPTGHEDTLKYYDYSKDKDQ